MIVDKQEIKKLFDSFPKKWRQAILRILKKSKTQLPLLNEEIEKLEFTLQEVNKKAM